VNEWDYISLVFSCLFPGALFVVAPLLGPRASLSHLYVCVSYLQIAEFVFLIIGLSGKMSIDQVILPIVLPARRGTVKQRNVAYLYFVVFVGSIQDLIFGNCFRAAKSCHWIQ
jgi:hypothetical protein